MFNPKVINRAYHLEIIDDITVRTLRYEGSLQIDDIFSYVDRIQLKYHVL